MKFFLLVLIASTSVSAFASENATKFGAFVVGKKLYVSMMLDSCNHKNAQIRVPQECSKNRNTKDLVLTCTVELSVMTTFRGCSDPDYAQLLEIDLSKTDLAPEVQLLTIHAKGQDVTVQL